VAQASFSVKDRLKMLADLEPLREGDQINDGEPSRWNSAADKRWIPVRPEKVAEVAYDQMERHTGARSRAAGDIRRKSTVPACGEVRQVAARP